jgi:hypothetical protein
VKVEGGFVVDAQPPHCHAVLSEWMAVGGLEF